MSHCNFSNKLKFELNSHKTNKTINNEIITYHRDLYNRLNAESYFTEIILPNTIISLGNFTASNITYKNITVSFIKYKNITVSFHKDKISETVMSQIKIAY